MKPKPRSEREVTRDIVDYMQLRKYLPVRSPAGPVRSMRRGQETPERANPPGFPDWCFVRPENFPLRRAHIWFMEIKKPGKRPTKLQGAWLERLRRDGFDADWYDGFRAPEGKRPFLGDGK